MKQTQHKLQVVFHTQYLHIISVREADSHHLFDAVFEKVLRMAGHLGTIRSA